jgi:hypothetical protein
MQVVEHLLELSGIGRNRMRLCWVSSAEGKLFTEYVTQFSDLTRELGPFDSHQFELPLAAIERAIDSPRIRWLMGMARPLTIKDNVYNERLNEEDYKKLLYRATGEEYEKALVLESLKQGPQLVREISGRIGLPVYTVAFWLNELKGAGQVKIKDYDDAHPRFIGLAA